MSTRATTSTAPTSHSRVAGDGPDAPESPAACVVAEGEADGDEPGVDARALPVRLRLFGTSLTRLPLL